MSRRGVTALRRCAYCGARTFDSAACEACADLPELDAGAGGEPWTAGELELELELQDLAARSGRAHDPSAWTSSADERSR